MTRKSSASSTLSTLLAAVLAALFVGGAGLTFAGEPTIERTLKLALGDDDPIVVHFDGDLEPGESRQLTTDDGRLVVLHRNDDGLSLEVDGETIELPAIEVHGGGAYAVHWDSEHSATIDHDIAIEEVGDGERIFVTKRIVAGTDDDPQAFVWHSGGHGQDLGADLEASGALDGLDDAERQRILDALGALTGGGLHKVIMLEKHEEHQHDDH
ncbi:MAG: hypothetical protein AAGC60_22155 [Acidobacteriota bacterium]